MQHVESSAPNQGARILRQKMAEKELSQGEVARRVGVGVDVVGRWLKEAHRPRGDKAELLEKEIGVPAGSWWQEPKPETEEEPDPAPAATGTDAKVGG